MENIIEKYPIPQPVITIVNQDLADVKSTWTVLKEYLSNVWTNLKGAFKCK